MVLDKSINITEECVRNAHSQALPPPAESETLAVFSETLKMFLINAKTWEQLVVNEDTINTV